MKTGENIINFLHDRVKEEFKPKEPSSKLVRFRVEQLEKLSDGTYSMRISQWVDHSEKLSDSWSLNPESKSGDS